MKRVQVQKEAQIDKRIVTAVIRAIAERNSFVVRYRDVYEQLDKLVEDNDEFYELEDKMYEAVSEGLLRGVYKFPGSLVVASPEPLSEEVLKVVEYITLLYQFRPYDGSNKRGEVDEVIHNFVKMQTSGCLEVASPAKAVYELAKAHGLAVREEAKLDDWHVGKIAYKIEGLDRPVVKEVYYCNRCLSFPDNEQFIEKCRS
jgi:hypothetical protein